MVLAGGGGGDGAGRGRGAWGGGRIMAISLVLWRGRRR